jgi:hypothetical protein
LNLRIKRAGEPGPSDVASQSRRSQLRSVAGGCPWFGARLGARFDGERGAQLRGVVVLRHIVHVPHRGLGGSGRPGRCRPRRLPGNRSRRCRRSGPPSHGRRRPRAKTRCPARVLPTVVGRLTLKRAGMAQGRSDLGQQTQEYAPRLLASEGGHGWPPRTQLCLAPSREPLQRLRASVRSLDPVVNRRLRTLEDLACTGSLQREHVLAVQAP